MKVILFSNFGGFIPDFFKGKIEKAQDRWNPELIEAVESCAVLNATEEVIREGSKIGGSIYQVFKTPAVSKYRAWCSELGIGGGVVSFTILDVDTKRPWIIDENDGVEYVVYIDSYDCIDESVNYHEVRE